MSTQIDPNTDKDYAQILSTILKIALNKQRNTFVDYDRLKERVGFVLSVVPVYLALLIDKIDNLSHLSIVGGVILGEGLIVLLCTFIPREFRDGPNLSNLYSQEMLSMKYDIFLSQSVSDVHESYNHNLSIYHKVFGFYVCGLLLTILGMMIITIGALI